MGEFALTLTAKEAALLDGKVGPEAQAVVSRAIDSLAFAELGEKQAAMIAAVLDVARTKGRLTYSVTMIASCPCCGRRDGYWSVKRSTRYKTRGQPDYSKPKVFRGIDLDRGFVTVQNHIGKGFCEQCGPTVEPVIRERLQSIPCETPAHWPGLPQRYRRHDCMKCGSCGWEGHEGQMRLLPTLMGNGHYPGGCPNCPATNQPLGRRVIEWTSGFELVAVAPSPLQPPAFKETGA